MSDMFEIIRTDQQFAMLKTGSVNASDYQMIWAEHRYRPMFQTRFILRLSGGTSPYLSPALHSTRQSAGGTVFAENIQREAVYLHTVR